MVPKSKLWHFRSPDMVYCGDLQFYVPVDEKTARAELRERHGLTRLPNDTEFWVDDGSDDIRTQLPKWDSRDIMCS